MKTFLLPHHPPRAERGSATIVVLAMLGIMMVFFVTNLVTIKVLTREVKMVEKKQEARLQKESAAPNHQASLDSAGAAPGR